MFGNYLSKKIKLMMINERAGIKEKT